MSKTYIVNYDKNKERYEEKEWNDKYINYLKCLYSNEKKYCKAVYNDPDDVKIHNEFYKDLENFLNIQENNYKNDLKEKWVYELSVENGGIKVKDENNNWLFTIFSDQFGFSAPKKKGHPYDVYAELNDYDDNSLKTISNCIYHTRTIGGSFLWSIDGGKGYNKRRGGTRYGASSNYYIEDRVDLTLLEIKKYYENKNKKYDDYLSYYLTGNLKKWLDHFIDFKTYVSFFCFNSFVDDKYMPKSLLKNDDNIDILDGRLWKRIMKGRNKEIEAKKKDYMEELKNVFNSLINMIDIRTNKIEELIERMKN